MLKNDVQITVAVDRRLLTKILVEATRDGRSAADVVRERLEASVLQQVKGELADLGTGTRPKRVNGAIHSFSEKWIIRVPLPFKCEVMRVARENALTQDELGWLVARAAIADQAWLCEVLAASEREKQQQHAGEAGARGLEPPGQRHGGQAA
jgi:hypothetical protein